MGKFYMLLKDDFDLLIDKFNGNSLNSEWQNKTYCNPVGKEKMISHDQFSNGEGSKKTPLILSEEDGYDGKPAVRLHGARAAKGYWYLAGDHVFPHMQDVIRLGLFFHCSIYQTVLLALKSEWERYIAEVRGYKVNTGDNYQDIFLDAPTALDLSSFKPDIKAVCGHIGVLSNMVPEQPHTPEIAKEVERLNRLGYQGVMEKEFSSLAQEIILNKLHFQSIQSKTFKDFVNKKINEKLALENGDERQEEFWINKCVWIELHEKVGDVMLSIHSASLQNARIRNEFLKVFGQEYVDLEEAILRVKTRERRIQVIKANSGMTETELDQALKKIEEEEQELLNKLRFDVRIAPVITTLESGDEIGQDQLNAYKKQLRDVLRELYSLLHPDGQAYKPEYKKLSEEQKAHLKNLWHRTQEIKEDELKYPEGTVGAESRSLEKLLDILATAKKILGHAGLDVNTDYIIEGETIAERITWLETEINKLKKAILNLQKELIDIKSNKEVLRQKQVIDCPAEHAKVKESMREKIKEYRKQGDELDLRLKKLLLGEAA